MPLSPIVSRTVLQIRWPLAATLLLSLFSPYGVQAADTPADRADQQAIAAKVKEIFRSRCLECHGGSATQGGVAILDTREMKDIGTVVPQEPDESLIYQVLSTSDEDARMPMGQPPLSAEEIGLVRKWVLAGAVDFPEDVSGGDDPAKAEELKKYRHPDYLLSQILEHQRHLPINERHHYRYFSSHHLLSGGATQQELDLQRDALFKAINHLSKERLIVQPIVVNPQISTLFAVDLRELGWHRTLARASSNAETAVTLNAFDLVLLEYPYAIIYDGSETYDALANEYLVPSKMVRPIPFVRTDWFVSTATLPPLYHDLLQLPRTLEELEEQLGVDAEDNLVDRIAKRAGMAVSGVSRNNRAVERHPFEHGAYWKSIDYASSRGTDNIFLDPIDLRGAGGEMIFNLPNGLQAYFVVDAAGARLDFAPTSIVTDKFAEDKTVRNGLSCIRCHDRGMKDFRDDVRPAVEKILGSGHIDKRATLELYPSREDMAQLVSKDQQRFLEAVEAVLGHLPSEDPLTPVSQRYLEAPLQSMTVAGELGLTNPEDLRILVRQPHITGLGMVALADSGVIRRDTWEEHYDQVVTALGAGIPIVPIDGLTRPDYLPVTSNMEVRLTTTKKSNIFSPGDELAIFIENRGRNPVFIEVVGRSASGQLASVLPAGTQIAAGDKLRFPESGSLTVQPSLGQEEILLYASEEAFPGGTIVRGNDIADRLVHPVYKFDRDHRIRVDNDARDMIKRTLTIETR